jgi:alpha-1,3-rhamnosyl/mannosyltransferase
LVIAGAPGWKTGPIYAAAADLQAEGSVRFLGRVAEDDLTAVLRSAALFVYPSLEEGFGLPPLEAMAHGVATLVSDAPALVEVSGAGAVVLSREDPSGWTSTIKALLADDEARQLLAHRGHVHASRYTWRRTAELTIDVYRQVIARGSR